MRKIHFRTQRNQPDLFEWAAAQVRRPVQPIVRRVALRGRVSELHAIAFVQANSIGPAGAR
jgi:hypothetical protein